MKPYRLLVTLALALGLLAAPTVGRCDGLHVRAFGARGDGKSDDTAAFQRALDAAARNGETVYVDPVKPGGGYVLTHKIALQPGVSLVGAPAGMPFMAWEGVPRKMQTGAVILARPAASQYTGPKKQALIELSGGNTVRGLYILYDQQPWPSDKEFEAPNTRYPYATDALRTARFVADHARPYGPTITILPGRASTTIEDITCGRYWDFFAVSGAGKVFIHRIYLYGYKRAFAMREAKDTVRIDGVHVVPNIEEPISWQHARLAAAITAHDDNIVFDFGSVDGYSINDVVVFLAHTGMRLGTSKAKPFVDTLTGERVVHPWGQAPWGSVHNMKLDNVTIGWECVLGTILPNQLSNCMVHTSIAPSDPFESSVGPLGRQAAVLVDPDFGGATLQVTNLSISSFAPRNVVSTGLMTREANGRAFLFDSPGRTASVIVNGLVMSNVPPTHLWSSAVGAKMHLRLIGWTRDGDPQPDSTIAMP